MDYRRMNRQADAAMMRHYLLKEQGYDDDVVRNMPYAELRECYEHYHEC